MSVKPHKGNFPQSRKHQSPESEGYVKFTHKYIIEGVEGKVQKYNLILLDTHGHMQNFIAQDNPFWKKVSEVYNTTFTYNNTKQ